MLPRDRSILFADDSPDDRFFLKHACAEAGIASPIAMVEDGDEIVKYLEGAGAYADRRAHPLPGLVVLDLKMPRMTGLETLAWIRGYRACRCVPVLMLSASINPGDIRQAYELGANGFLAKPSTAQELIELMRALKSFWLRFNEYSPCIEEA
ncbi:MAG TPA: response regulator [Elusimicrobiota bacterium]|nr:response regulator [Elusimicrobiota bacterium]